MFDFIKNLFKTKKPVARVVDEDASFTGDPLLRVSVKKALRDRANEHDVAKLLGALESLKNGFVPVGSKGICGNLTELTGIYDFGIFADLFCGWEHHSGNYAYPIPSDDGYGSEDKWSGEQLEYRLSLIDYTIARLKEFKA